jgi:predicted porin
MKKHLIAAAVAAAVAVPAVAQVTVSGNLDTGYATSKLTSGGDSVKFTRTGNASAMSTSTIAFSGSEDLGGGLKASFFVNNSLSTNTGALGARDTWVQVEGGFGGIKIGRFTPAAEATIGGFAVSGTVNMPGSVDFVFGGSTYGGTPTAGTGSTLDMRTGSGIATGINEIGRQAGNIQYTSPSFSGFKVTIGHIKSKAEATAVIAKTGSGLGAATVSGKSELTQTDAALTYSAGPLSLGVTAAQQDMQGSASTATTKDEADFQAVGASYKLAAATLRYAYIEREDTVDGALAFDTEIHSFGVTVPLGAVSLFAGYVDSDMAYATTADNEEGKGYQVGVVYSLSKRTNAYVMTGKDEFKVKSTGVKTKADGFAIGLRHSF